MEGQVRMEARITDANTLIDISSLALGVYIVNIAVDGNIFNKRLVKN